MDFVESRLDAEEQEMETVREYVTALQYHNDRAHFALDNLPKKLTNSRKGSKREALKPRNGAGATAKQAHKATRSSSPGKISPVTKAEFDKLNPALCKRLSLARVNEVIEGIQATLKATRSKRVRQLNDKRNQGCGWFQK